jgi:hypothetical protein
MRTRNPPVTENLNSHDMTIVQPHNSGGERDY